MVSSMVSNQIFALVQQDLGLALEQSAIRLITYIKGDYDVEVTWFEYSKALRQKLLCLERVANNPDDV
jgi:hypothetical protein